MRPILAAAFALLVLAACRAEEGKGASVETSPGGISYARLFLPEAEIVAIQIAWPSDWTRRDEVNQAVPYLGASLILAGGALGWAPGEAGEVFADLGAEGSLWVTPDHLHGEIIVPRDNLARAVDIANAHLASPTLDPDWLDRVRQTVAGDIAEANAQPAMLGLDTLRWVVLGDTPLRRFLSLDPPKMIDTARHEDVVDWHARTLTRTGALVVIAGALDADTAGRTVDALLAGLPEVAPAAPLPPPRADFRPQRILLHVPDAPTSSLIMAGPLPPTRNGREFEDILLTIALGGDDRSVLFEAVRTRLRASYGFGAALSAFSRERRYLLLSGEVETARLAEAESVVRSTYAAFMAEPAMGNLEARKAPFLGAIGATTDDPVRASSSALLAILDGLDPAAVFDLPDLLAGVDQRSIEARATMFFPPANVLTVIAVSPDAGALPGACVINFPVRARDCR